MRIFGSFLVLFIVLISFTSCQKNLSFDTGGLSVGSLKSDVTGDCLPVTVNGVFQTDSVLTNNNFVDVQVNVSIWGTFDIRSDTLNGYSFSKTGSVGNGLNTIRLYASGKPVSSGTNTFTIKYNTSICTFDISCGTAGSTSNADYIPQTNYSNWSYKIVGGTPDDTSYVHVLPNPIVINGNSYKIFETVNSINYPGAPLDSFYYRKNGGMYYHIFDDTYYFDNGFNTDGLVLDSSLAVNASWIINLGNNTWGGQPATGSIKATILAKGALVSIAGNNYSNIIKVEYVFRYNTGAGDVDYDRWEIWYVRGIGQVYEKDNNIPVTSIYEVQATRVQVY